jgi:hypothetical protein
MAKISLLKDLGVKYLLSIGWQRRAPIGLFRINKSDIRIPRYKALIAKALLAGC